METENSKPTCSKCQGTGWLEDKRGCDGGEMCNCQYCECAKGRQLMRDINKVEIGIGIGIIGVLVLIGIWKLTH